MSSATTNIVAVVMGPCGIGKSAVAAETARRLGGAFVEADDHHTAGAKAQMASGAPLTDQVRMPWLERVAIAAHAADRPTLVACSALKRAYRDHLRHFLDSPVFVHLTAPREVIARRLAARHDHFVGVDLLDSQMAILEPLGPDEAGITLDVSAPLASVCEQVLDFMVAQAAANPGQDGPAAQPAAVRQHMQGR